MFFATQPRAPSDTDSASENGDEDTELLTTLFNPRIKSKRDNEKKETMIKQVYEEYCVSVTQMWYIMFSLLKGLFL